MEPRLRLSTLKGDLTGGLSAAVVALPFVVSAGLVAFAPLGPAYAPAGIAAALYGTVLLSLAAALWGSAAVQISLVRNNLAALLTPLLLALSDAPALQAALAAVPDRPLAAALLLIFPTALLAGALQLLLGAVGLGNVLKFVPYPVMAGLMNGVAILIIIAQLPALLGLPALTPARWLAAGPWMILWSLFLAAAAVAATLLTRRYLKKIPAPPVGLAVGALVCYGLDALAPIPPTPVIGALDATLSPPPFAALARWVTDGGFWSLLPELAATATTLAVVASILTLLSATAADELTMTRHDANRELIGQGLGNMLAAVFGGLPGAGHGAGVQANFHGGGRTRLAGVCFALWLLAGVLLLGPLLGRIPLAVSAGIIILLSLDTIDLWTYELIRKARGVQNETRLDVRVNLFLVLLVTLLVIFAGPLAALSVGMVLAFAYFLNRTRRAVIRRTYRGDKVRSKTARPGEDLAALQQRGRAIRVFELQGQIFFGSADQLALEVGNALTDADTIILDLKRVSDVDSTGAMILRRLDRLLASQGKTLFIAHVVPRDPLENFLLTLGFERPWREGRFFVDIDAALARAEDKLLDGNTHPEREIALNEMEILRALEPAALDYLASLLDKRRFAAGELIVAEGERDNTLYFLAAGLVSVRLRLPDNRRWLRLAGYRAGVVFGEVALLGAQPRTADVYADREAVVYRLTADRFWTLCRERPAVANRLLINLGRVLSMRLHATSDALRELE